MNDELYELSNEVNNLASIGKCENEQKKPLGARIAKFIFISFFVFVALYITLYPYCKVEDETKSSSVIGEVSNKTVACYNPISKICFVLYMEKHVELDKATNTEITYYEVKEIITGHVNIHKSLEEQKRHEYISIGLLYLHNDSEEMEFTSRIIIKQAILGSLGDCIMYKTIEKRN